MAGRQQSSVHEEGGGPWVVLGLTGAYFATRLAHLTLLPVFLDEALHIQWARGDRAFSMLLARTGKWLAVLIIGLFDALPINTLAAARLAAVLSGCITLWLLVAVGRELDSRKLGYVAAFLYVVSPYSLFFDRLALADEFLSAATAATILVSVTLVRRPTWQAQLGLGALLILAGLLKFSGLGILPIPLAAVLTLMPVREWYRGFLRAGPPVLCVVALAGIWHHVGLTPVDVAEKTSGGQLRDALPLLYRNVYLLKDLLVPMLTPPLFLACLVSPICLIGRLSRRAARFLVLVLAVLLLPYMFFAVTWFPRYLVPVLVPLYLLAGFLLREADTIIVSMRWAPVPRWRGFAYTILLVPLLLQDWCILVEPERADLPQMVRNEFITGWTSGYGLVELGKFLEGEAAKHPSGINIVRTAFADQPHAGVDVYLARSQPIDRFSFPAETLLTGITEVLQSGRATFFVFDGAFPYPESEHVPEAIKRAFASHEIWNHPKPEGQEGFHVWQVELRGGH